MSAFLSKLFAKSSRPTDHLTRRNQARLGVETLERRDVLNTTFNPTTGILSVVGTEGADTITIDQVSGAVRVTVNGRVELSVTSSSVRALSVDARGGDDTVRNNTSVPSTLNGGWGND